MSQINKSTITRWRAVKILKITTNQIEGIDDVRLLFKKKKKTPIYWGFDNGGFYYTKRPESGNYRIKEITNIGFQFFQFLTKSNNSLVLPLIGNKLVAWCLSWCLTLSSVKKSVNLPHQIKIHPALPLRSLDGL
jgi:hypothetical protein